MLSVDLGVAPCMAMLMSIRDALCHVCFVFSLQEQRCELTKQKWVATKGFHGDLLCHVYFRFGNCLFFRGPTVLFRCSRRGENPARGSAVLSGVLRCCPGFGGAETKYILIIIYTYFMHALIHNYIRTGYHHTCLSACLLKE